MMSLFERMSQSFQTDVRAPLSSLFTNNSGVPQSNAFPVAPPPNSFVVAPPTFNQQMATPTSSSPKEQHPANSPPRPSAQQQQPDEMVTERPPSPRVVQRRMSLETVGDYAVGKTLGEGTFGKVKLGYHRLTGELVALKYIEHSRLNNSYRKRMAEREMRIMSKLDHPNIVKMYEIVELPNVTVLVLQYIKGSDLLDHIVNRPKMPEKELRRLFIQILDAVEYLHLHLVIHRDLKPDNILIEEATGNMKLFDFGLSNIVTPGEMLSTYCGSPLYASPEIVMNRKYLGPEVDVWSLGVILYVMCTGNFPWTGASLPQQLRNAVKGNYVVPEAASPELKDLLSRILQPDPTKRITLPEMFSHPWVRAVQTWVWPPSEIDPQILEEMRRLGFNEEQTTPDQIVGPKPTQAAYTYQSIQNWRRRSLDVPQLGGAVPPQQMEVHALPHRASIDLGEQQQLWPPRQDLASGVRRARSPSQTQSASASTVPPQAKKPAWDSYASHV